MAFAKKMMRFPSDLLSFWIKVPSNCDTIWHGISMSIHVTFFTGSVILWTLGLIRMAIKIKSYDWSIKEELFKLFNNEYLITIRDNIISSSLMNHWEAWAFAIFNVIPVKNMTGIFSRLFDGSLLENDTKSDGNPIIFLANAMEIPWLELVQNPCHVWAWRTNKTWINYME